LDEPEGRTFYVALSEVAFCLMSLKDETKFFHESLNICHYKEQIESF